VSELQEQLNFKVTVVVPSDGKWGGKEKNGTGWTGLVGMLLEGKADFSAAPVSKTLERQQVTRVSY
jgi:hypothetical protein